MTQRVGDILLRSDVTETGMPLTLEYWRGYGGRRVRGGLRRDPSLN
jgi:hypothetical protein